MSDADDPVENFIERMAATPDPDVHASTQLKSRLYSALVRQAQRRGPLRSLSATAHAGRPLCVFEKSVQVLRLGESAESINYCRVCHARLFGEWIEHAPLYWKGCPYASF